MKRARIILVAAALVSVACNNEDSGVTSPGVISPIIVQIPIIQTPGIVQTPGVSEVPVPISPGAPPPQATPSERCANGNMPVARFNIRLFAVLDAWNQPRPFFERTADDLMGPFYRGETLRFDATGRDRYGSHTDGCTGDGPRWHAEPPELLEWHSPHGWMPSGRVAGRGYVTITAEFEGGVLAYRLNLSFW